MFSFSKMQIYSMLVVAASLSMGKVEAQVYASGWVLGASLGANRCNNECPTNTVCRDENMETLKTLAQAQFVTSLPFLDGLVSGLTQVTGASDVRPLLDGAGPGPSVFRYSDTDFNGNACDGDSEGNRRICCCIPSGVGNSPENRALYCPLDGNNSPSAEPSRSPSAVPSKKPSESPSAKPSRSPSAVPSAKPSRSPSAKPSVSAAPSEKPSISAAPTTKAGKKAASGKKTKAPSAPDRTKAPKSNSAAKKRTLLASN